MTGMYSVILNGVTNLRVEKWGRDMRKFRVNIWDNGEYEYQAAYGFVPFLKAYLHEDVKDAPRGVMLVAPGGGYCMCVPHEGEPVALEFYNKGFDAYVLTYTTDVTMSIPLKDIPLKDISRAVRLIRRARSDAGITREKLAICGFSAGAHLCGSLVTHYMDVKDPNEELDHISNRPDAAILSYPVITMGKYTHDGSRISLLGRRPGVEERRFYSLENHVNKNTPPCFLWQTAEDELVPVNNSYLFAQALIKAGVPCAHYVFPFGLHGLSLGRELTEVPDDYTFEQLYAVVRALYSGKTVGVSDKRIAELKDQFPSADENGRPAASDDEPDSVYYSDISLWPDLAVRFLDGLGD